MTRGYGPCQTALNKLHPKPSDTSRPSQIITSCPPSLPFLLSLNGLVSRPVKRRKDEQQFLITKPKVN